jgi:hypothetical protein
MITLILITLAGICNSIMDVLFTRFDKSIFKNLNPLYWNPKYSWKYKWKIPLQPPTKNGIILEYIHNMRKGSHIVQPYLFFNRCLAFV